MSLKWDITLSWAVHVPTLGTWLQTHRERDMVWYMQGRSWKAECNWAGSIWMGVLGKHAPGCANYPCQTEQFGPQRNSHSSSTLNTAIRTGDSRIMLAELILHAAAVGPRCGPRVINQLHSLYAHMPLQRSGYIQMPGLPTYGNLLQ